MRDAPESSVEDYLADAVRFVDGVQRKVKWPGRKGAPDRLVGIPSRVVGLQATFARHALVELKRPGLAAGFPNNYKPGTKAYGHEQAQAREHARLREIGFDVVVIDSREGVELLIDWLMR